jgi:ABC-type branched-subunit amino acid transport system ATPase component
LLTLSTLLLDETWERSAPVIVDESGDTLARLRAEFGVAIVIIEQLAESVLRLSWARC